MDYSEALIKVDTTTNHIHRLLLAHKYEEAQQEITYLITHARMLKLAVTLAAEQYKGFHG